MRGIYFCSINDDYTIMIPEQLLQRFDKSAVSISKAPIDSVFIVYSFVGEQLAARIKEVPELQEDLGIGVDSFQSIPVSRSLIHIPQTIYESIGEKTVCLVALGDYIEIWPASEYKKVDEKALTSEIINNLFNELGL